MSKQSEAVKKWRKSTKQRIIDSMGGKCQCCGYNKCNEALDVHHIDPNEKELSFGAIRANPTAWSNIVRELKKCVLVCRNCHAEIHYGDRVIPNNFTNFNEDFTDYQKTFQKEIIDINSESCPVCKTPISPEHRFCSLVCSGKFNHRKNGTTIRIQT